MRIAAVVLAVSLIGCSSKKGSSESADDAAPMVAIDGGAGSSSSVGGPDPLYPTAKSVGTGELFAVKEPDRGPLITRATIPPASKTPATTFHDHCDYDYHGLVCGAARKNRGKVGWEVRRGPTEVVGRRFRQRGSADTLVITKDAAKKMLRLVVLRPDGRVDWARSFSVPGKRFTSRARGGANQLQGCGAMEIELDAAGRASSISCLQWSGKPMRDIHGVGVTRLARDSAGFVVERRFFDPRGNPIERNDGVHRVAVGRDGAGRVTSEQAFDRSGGPRVDGETGCHKRVFVYDSIGRRISKRCEVSAGKPNATTTRYRYDRRGCRTAESYYAANGKPAANRHGVFEKRWKRDRYCFSVGYSCFSGKRTRVACRGAVVAEVREKRDARGDVVRRRHFDIKGKATRHPEHMVHEVRYRYDDGGNQIEEACFSEGGTAAECSSAGYHAQTFKRDQGGNVVETRFLDLQRKAVVSRGVLVEKTSYDNYDHPYEVVGFGPSGKPHVERGMAKRRQIYDESHRLAALILFDAAGQPARYVACFTGVQCPVGRPWHAVRVVWSTEGKALYNHYFDHDKQRIETVDCAKHGCWPR